MHAQPLWTRRFTIGTLTNFILMLNYFMPMVVMTAYALEHYAAAPSVAALCASIFIIGTLIARFLSAPMMAKLGERGLLVAGVVAVVIFSALYLVPLPLALLFAIRLLHGFGYGAASTAIAATVTATIPSQRKGEGVGYFMLSSTLGSAVGPFTGIFLSSSFGYWTLFTVALVVAACALPCALLLGKPRRVDKAIATLQAAEDEIAAGISDAPAEVRRERAAEAEATTDAGARKGGRVLDVFIECSAIPISIVAGVVYFGYSSLLTFLTPFAAVTGLVGAASVFFVIYALAVFVTRPFTGKAFDRRGASFVMIPAFVSITLGMVLVALAKVDPVLLIAAAFLGYGIGTIQSSGLSVAIKAAPQSRINVANATYYVLLDFGVGVGPLILGIFVPLIGYVNLYFCMAALGVIALVIFLVIMRNPRNR